MVCNLHCVGTNLGMFNLVTMSDLKQCESVVFGKYERNADWPKKVYNKNNRAFPDLLTYNLFIYLSTYYKGLTVI